jgi:hypothetical protein
LLVPDIEEACRLAGLSPRRAPDLARARILCAPEDPPAVVIADPASCGEEAFAVIDSFAHQALAVILQSGDRPEDAARVERLGAWAVRPEELPTRLPALFEG